MSTVVRFVLETVYEEFGCDDQRRKETRGSIKEPQPGLFSDIGNVSKVPRNQVIDLVK
jgi:hypothetical protein